MSNIDVNDMVNYDDFNWTPVELALIACCRAILAGKGVLVFCKAIAIITAAAAAEAAAVAEAGGAAHRSQWQQ